MELKDISLFHINAPEPVDNFLTGLCLAAVNTVGFLMGVFLTAIAFGAGFQCGLELYLAGL